VLLTAFLVHSIQAQVTMTDFWNSLDHPASVEASVVGVSRISDDVGTTTVWAYRVDCPAASSPENDACRARKVYPQDWVHTQGSIFQGTATATLDNSTTTWTCALGGCPGCAGYTGTNDASCTSTVVSGGSTKIGATVMNSCFLEGNYIPVVLTAGAEKLPDQVTALAPGDILKSVDSALSSYNCPARTTMLANAASAPMTSAVPSPGQTTGATGPSNTGSGNTGPSNTSGSAKPTTSPSGGGSWRLVGVTEWEKHYSFTILLGLVFSLLSQTLN
jgi:hypothetical protein